MCGDILAKYDSLGGTGSFLGWPQSNELVNPDGFGRRSVFQNATIYWSSGTGAHPVGGRIGWKWGDKGWEGGFLHYPISDELTNVGNTGKRQAFQGGSIYWSTATDAHSIGGAIGTKWGEYSWETGTLGYPKTDELVTPDTVGRRQEFVNGHIYWSAPTGAHPVQGGIFNLWAAKGYEGGAFGYPRADSYVTGCMQRAQDFQMGKLVTNIDSYLNGTNGSTNAVDGARIAYTKNTRWDNLVGPAADSWNTLGSITIAPKGILEIGDINIQEIDRQDLAFNGQYNYNLLAPDVISLNYYYIKNFTSNEVQAVIAHEFGHALGEEHSCDYQLMTPNDREGRHGVYTPQNLDVDVYRYLWK